MARGNFAENAGAAGRATLEQVKGLCGVVLQPKIDGALARVHLDRRGRIERIFMRSGAEFSRELVGHLLGAFVGWPGAELVGELEAHTEAANRHAETRGWRALHLFDCIRFAGVYVAREPYRVRRDYLWQMQSEVVNLGAACPWYEDVGRARDRASGRFVGAVPTDWRLTPIVPQFGTAHADRAWTDWVERDAGEGLVAVALDAPMGARRSKLKIKRHDTIDCKVVSVGPTAAILEWGGGRFAVSAKARADRELVPGSVVEVLCDGFYEQSSQPRNARILRTRSDLGATIGG